MKTKFIGPSGTKIAKITFIAPIKRGQWWSVKCDCGKFFNVRARCVLSGNTTNCGCVRSIKTIERNKAAAIYTNEIKESKEYGIWCGIKDRCLNTKSKKYKDYGGRGILMCDRWRNSFFDFLKDMGSRPSIKHSIDRKDNNGNYEPENCRWATSFEQGNNTRVNIRITHRGETKTMSEWGRFSLVGKDVFRQRIVTYKWDFEKALNTPAPKMGVNKKMGLLTWPCMQPYSRVNKVVPITLFPVDRITNHNLLQPCLYKLLSYSV